MACVIPTMNNSYRGFPRVGRPLRMILHADLQIPEHARIVHASKLKMTVTGNLLCFALLDMSPGGTDQNVG